MNVVGSWVLDLVGSWVFEVLKVWVSLKIRLVRQKLFLFMFNALGGATQAELPTRGGIRGQKFGSIDRSIFVKILG